MCKQRFILIIGRFYCSYDMIISKKLSVIIEELSIDY